MLCPLLYRNLLSRTQQKTLSPINPSLFGFVDHTTIHTLRQWPVHFIEDEVFSSFGGRQRLNGRLHHELKTGSPNPGGHPLNHRLHEVSRSCSAPLIHHHHDCHSRQGAPMHRSFLEPHNKPTLTPEQQTRSALLPPTPPPRMTTASPQRSPTPGRLSTAAPARARPTTP